MPELPEVETITRQLKEGLKYGVWRVTGVHVQPGTPARLFNGKKDVLGGHYIKTIERVGKYIRIGLDQPTLVIHLGMTGQLSLENDVVSPRPQQTYVYNHKYLRVVVRLWDGLQAKYLCLYDMRKFGRVYVYPDGSANILDGVAPDIMQLDEQGWARVQRTVSISKRSKTMKDILLDQSIVSGIGNIYANEGMSLAGLHPLVKASDLTEREWLLLYKSLRQVIAQGIHNGGTTFSDYGDLYGNQGKNQHHLAVFKREGEPCRLCTGTIERIKVAGRSSYYCRKCQSLESGYGDEKISRVLGV